MTTINVTFQTTEEGQTRSHAERWDILTGRGIVYRTNMKDNQPIGRQFYFYPQYVPGVLDSLYDGKLIHSLPLAPTGRIRQVRAV